MSPETGKGDPKVDELRVRNGLWAVGLGLGTIVVVLALAMWRFTSSQDVVAVVGAVTGVVGTVVGAFFGLQIGSEGKEKADKEKDKAQVERKEAEDKVEKLAGALSPAEAERILAS